MRVRSRPLSEIDETKLALAVFLMAKRLVEDRTDTETPVAPLPAAARDDASDSDRGIA